MHSKKRLQFLELKIPPLALVVITATGMWAIAQRVAALHFSLPGAAWLSAALAIVGSAIAVAGVAEFRKAGTTVDPRVPGQSAHLVAGGVYRYSRNPMYVGFLFILCGWGVFLGSALALVGIPAFVACLNRLQIAPEERAMREKFGASYTRYASAVRRWL